MSDESQPTELDLLKTKAKKLGIPLRGNPSVETVKEMINEHISEIENGVQSTVVDKPDAAKEKRLRNKKIRDEALKLVRVQITCMNPAKKDWQGEIISVGNKVIGTVKKFIPYQLETHENGYHIPNVIYKHLVSRKFQSFKTIKHSNGETTKKAVELKEFNIAVLPQLTEAELKELKAEQASRNGSGN